MKNEHSGAAPLLCRCELPSRRCEEKPKLRAEGVAGSDVAISVAWGLIADS